MRSRVCGGIVAQTCEARSFECDKQELDKHLFQASACFAFFQASGSDSSTRLTITNVRWLRCAAKSRPIALINRHRPTMAFADQLKQLPPVSHLVALELIDAHGAVVARIENKPGQAGSLAVYAALAAKHGSINAQAAQEGLAIYDEHTIDAQANPGKHPNIDRLIDLIAQGTALNVRLIEA